MIKGTLDDFTKQLLAERDSDFDKVIGRKDEFTRLIMSRSTFLGKQYLSIRYWYLDFDETWQPTGDGVNWLYDDFSFNALADALTELVK